MSTVLFLSSADKTQGTSYDFTLDTQIDHTTNVDGFFVTVLNIEFMNAVYPISTNVNDSISITDGGTVIVQIGANNYTGVQFCTTLKAALIAATALTHCTTYDVSYVDQSKIITISNTAANAPFTLNYVADHCYNEMGFAIGSGDTAVPFSSAGQTLSSTGLNPSSIVGICPSDFAGSKYVDVISNFAGKSYSSSSSSNTICRITLDVPFGYILKRPPDYGYTFFSFNRDITRIRFQLRDNKNKVWKLPSTQDFSLVIKIDNAPSNNLNKRRVAYEDDNVMPLYRPTKYVRPSDEAAYEHADGVHDYMPAVVALSESEQNNTIMTGESTGNRPEFVGASAMNHAPLGLSQNSRFPTSVTGGIFTPKGPTSTNTLGGPHG